MKKILQKSIFVFAASIVALYTVLFASSVPAFALGTYVWNNRGGYVPMYYAPTSANNSVKVWMPNRTKFAMSCWEDFQWYTGNYTTNRWFLGQEYSHGSWGYVNASYVINQTAVPHC